MEMKKLASDGALPVLFVSGDTKNDWMERVHSKTLGPLAVLRREFVDDTGQAFHKTTWRGLLGYAAKYLSVEVAAETLEVVEADERQYRRVGWNDSVASGPAAEWLRDSRNQPLFDVLREQREANARSVRDIFREMFPATSVKSLADIIAESGGTTGLDAIRDATRLPFLQDARADWFTSVAGTQADGFTALRNAAQASGADSLRHSADGIPPRVVRKPLTRAETDLGVSERADDGKADE